MPLDPTGSRLDDVVLSVRYRKEKRPYRAISQVKAKDIGIFSNTSPVQALQGRAAGVQVIQNSGSPGGAISEGSGVPIQSREETTVVCVDGFPLNAVPWPTEHGRHIIIEVLKDASAMLFMDSWANGVVMVTTKKGKGVMYGELRVWLFHSIRT